MINDALLGDFNEASKIYDVYPAGLPVLAGSWRFTQTDGSRASIKQSEFRQWLDLDDLLARNNCLF
jgi:hypothetical protein